MGEREFVNQAFCFTSPCFPRSHHIPRIGQEEVLSDVCRQKIEENPPVVELDFLHAISLFFSLTNKNIHTAVAAFPTFTTRGQKKPSHTSVSETRND